MKRPVKTLLLLGGGTACLFVGELSILLGLSSLQIWVTPFCWTGYILSLDGFLSWKRGSSLILDHPLRMLLAVPISAGLWAIFEGYNLLLKNWEYLYIPAHPGVKAVGFFWSFGTILPALLETNDLLEFWGCFKRVRISPGRPSPRILLFLGLLGTFFLITPLVTASPYDFPSVWLGFLFLLEPFNYRFGGESLLGRLSQGDPQRALTLFLTGGIMGFFWEFWNFWAGAKWIYHIPVPGSFKIFEMPLLGFLGFLPFALEFYAMYHATLLLLRKILPPVFAASFKGVYRQCRSGGHGT